MKNSTKVILLVSICFVIIGSMLSVIGVVLGGSPSFSLTGSGIDVKKSGREYELDKTKLGNISSIDMDVDCADVTFLEADDFYIEYDYYGGSEPYYEVKNGKLIFKDNRQKGSFNLNFGFSFLPDSEHDYGVKIYLPANAMLDKVDIDQSGGEITIGGFQASELTVVNSFGDVELNDIDAKTSDIELSSGNLVINGMDSGDSTIDNSYGDITITDFNRNNKYPDAAEEITLSSGSLDIDGLTAASLTIDNSFGDIDMSDVIVGELTCKLSSGSATVNNGKFNNASFNNDFGDVNLELIGKESDYALDLDTDFGGVSVMGNDEGDSYDNHNAAAHTIAVSADSGDVGVEFTANGSN